MALARFLQTSAERKRYVVDYSDWLDSGETITTFSVTISPSTTPAFAVDSTAVAGSGTQIVFFASGGIDGGSYDVELLATTTLTERKQDCIQFTVRDC